MKVNLLAKSETKDAAISERHDPLSILSTKFESVECTCTMIIGAHNKCTFEATLKVNKKVFIASAPSSIIAKRKAALVALEEMVIRTPKSCENNQASGNSVGKLLSVTSAGDNSNGVVESREPECDRLYENFENVPQKFDDEQPTTSRKAAKYLSMKKILAGRNGLSLTTLVQENCGDTQEKDGRNVEFSQELNRNLTKAIDSNKSSKGSEVMEILEEPEPGNARSALTVIDLLEYNSNIEKMNTENQSAVIAIDDEISNDNSLDSIRAIEIDSDDNKSVEEIINECMSQILKDDANSAGVMEIHDYDRCSEEEVIPINENANSAVTIENNQESTLLKGLNKQTKDSPSPSFNLAEITEEIDEGKIFSDDVIDTATKGIKIKTKVGDISTTQNSETGNQKVTLKGGMKKTLTRMKHKVKRLVTNPISIQGEISDGIQPYSPNAFMHPVKNTAVFRKSILKPNKNCNNLNGSLQNQNNTNLSCSEIPNNNDLLEDTEESIIQLSHNEKRSSPRIEIVHEMSEKSPANIIQCLSDNNRSPPRIPTTDEMPENASANVIQRLNQICPGIRYNLEAETGESGNTFCLMSATLNDRKYFGDGRTKSEATTDVAKKILSALSKIIPQIQLINQEQIEQTNIQRTVRPQAQCVNQEPVAVPHISNAERPQIQVENQEQPTELHDRCNVTQQQIALSNREQPRQRRVGFQEMLSANQRPATQMQSHPYLAPQIRFVTRQQPYARRNMGRYDVNTGLNMCTLSLPQHESNIVETLVLNHFREVTGGRTDVLNYKVLAGVVMTRNLNFANAQVVAIATGAKCVTESANIDCNGGVLNDGHAEVMARRCLMKYLYTQLRWHCYPEWAEKSIFARNPNGLQYAFALKPDVHFHLYISSAPCGDARVFIDRNNHEKYGELRTKVDGGLGTKAIGNRFFPQTLNGINHGVPLLTMSCSDKIARWNVLGIQGSLLSTLVEPIYLYSIVLGSMFHTKHLYRAVCGRLEQKLNFLPKPYHLNRPLLGQTSTFASTRNANRGVPSPGVNWTFGDSQFELVYLPRGRLMNNDVSFLCKQVLFSKYIYLLQHLKNIEISPCPNNYAKAKELARDYDIAKQELVDAFQHAGLGCWVKKPLELNDFTMNF